MRDRYEYLEQQYKPRDRHRAQEMKKGVWWCMVCDRALVGGYGKCKACGHTSLPRKIKGIEYPT